VKFYVWTSRIVSLVVREQIRFTQISPPLTKTVCILYHS